MKNLIFILSTFVLIASCTKCPLESPTDVNRSITNRTTYSISGKVIWEHDDASGVAGVVVALSGAESQTTTTDANGDYTFSVSALGGYTVTPSKNVNKINGVNVANATAIQSHLTNNIPINDPYKRIAADANKNNTISTADATIINQAFLGNPLALIYLSPSWKFVVASYNLINPPGQQNIPIGYPQSISFTLTGNLSNVNFVGIKRGDVNGSADPSQ